MIASMTGFARQERHGPFGTLVCEIRSVNHRFLDASVRLPESCRALESELRQTLARELRRAGLKRGIASACIGGGQGIALLIEIPSEGTH